MTNFLNILFGYFALVVIVANGTPFLLETIHSIVAVRPYEQVRRANADGIVAMMAGQFAACEASANMGFQRKPMRAEFLSASVECPVSCTPVVCASPHPAITNSFDVRLNRPVFVYLSPKVGHRQNAFVSDIAGVRAKLSLGTRAILESLEAPFAISKRVG